MAKPIRALEMHYPVIQFLIIIPLFHRRDIVGRFRPFNQNFRKFVSSGKWYRNFFKKFPEIPETVKCPKCKYSTKSSRNSGSKIEWKENFREKLSEIWVYLARLSSFWKFLKNLFHSPLEVTKNSNRKLWLNGKRP